MNPNNFPPGWNETRVQRLIAHYDNQTEDEELAEFEAPFTDPNQTMMAVPTELVPAVVQLIEGHRNKVVNGKAVKRQKPASASIRRGKTSRR